MGAWVSLKNKAEGTAMTPQECRQWSRHPLSHLADIVQTHGGDRPEHQLLAADALESLVHLAQKDLVLQSGHGRAHFHHLIPTQDRNPSPICASATLRTLWYKAEGLRQYRVVVLCSRPSPDLNFPH